VEILSQLWDKNGRVTIPHFYDDVLPLSETEKKEFTFTCDPENYRKEWEMEAFGNEKGYSLSEANWVRPTVEINGIGGGYFGAGFKTVIPAKATAKISCRLVPKQDPKKILASLKKFLQERVPKGMKCEMQEFGTGEAVRGKLGSDLSNAVLSAYEEVFQKPCIKIMGGGSVPIVGDMVKVLQADVVMMGLGLDADRIHAPNENFSLDRLEKGFLIIARTLQKLGEKRK
jgi:acetylornithine deacetylase/succinyl-diaminopimelate desuccinylase-like protein